MKIRSDSAFAKLTEEQCDMLLEGMKSMTMVDLVEMLKQAKPEPIVCTVASLSKFLQRYGKEKAVERAEENVDVVERLAKNAESPRVREATLQAMRDRMFDLAFETNNRELMMEMYASLNEEKDKERAAAIEERKAKVAEENAKLGWRKLECENARAGLRALPRIRELLMDGARPAEERVGAALALLGKVDGGILMLRDGNRTED